ncbi:DoxX family protein [Microvirga sp. 2TAF3]|uniref:DoxX family protein n=1 Tax=Microvirga sp. 2TAF3 TaxID=3233014 RepID=UPI003F9723E9
MGSNKPKTSGVLHGPSTLLEAAMHSRSEAVHKTGPIAKAVILSFGAALAIASAFAFKACSSGSAGRNVGGNCSGNARPIDMTTSTSGGTYDWRVHRYGKTRSKILPGEALTQVVAFTLAGFCLLAAFLFHKDFTGAEQLTHIYKNIAIVGGSLAFVAFGPGAWSLDVLIGWRATSHAFAPHTPEYSR